MPILSPDRARIRPGEPLDLDAAARRRVIARSTSLDAPANTVWEALGSPATLAYVAAPLLRFPGLNGHGRWEVGRPLTTRLVLFGVLPLWRHTVTLVLCDHAAGVMQSSERGGPVRLWQHRIAVEPTGPTQSRYTDEIELDSGALTTAVALFARGFYAWRQRRWRKLATDLGHACTLRPPSQSGTSDREHSRGPT